MPEAKGRKRDGSDVDDAKGRECGIEREVQVKKWFHGRTGLACLTKKDWKG